MLGTIGSGHNQEALPPGPPAKAQPLQSINFAGPQPKVTGSKGYALGGVQRQSLWSGCGVKPRV